MNRWKQTEIERLTEMYREGIERKHIAIALNRTFESVKSAIERYKIGPRKETYRISTKTGVGWYFCAAHRDLETGKLHGHTWEVIAWFKSDENAMKLQLRLKDYLKSFDHEVLDDSVSWAEKIAADICASLEDCIEVQISRPAERIYAKAEKHKCQIVV